MKKVIVWFNHWFSTAYHIINLLKNDDDINFFVIGTNENENSVVREACDAWFTEPAGLSEKEYIDFCMDFCIKNMVDVFVPKRNMALICKHIHCFEEIGIKVMADHDYNIIRLLQNKQSAYEFFSKSELCHIPEYRVVNNAEGFISAYRTLKTDSNRVCIKYVNDEGAASFRVIDDSIMEYGGLLRQVGLKMSYMAVVDALSEKESFSDLMVMPYLSGTEVSVDCLNTENGLIMVPRFKSAGRTEVIKFDRDILSMCEDIYKRCNIQQPFNIQFKYHEDIPYLLEINTRMSGGIQFSCLAAQVNIPNIAVNQLIGIHKHWRICEREQTVSFIETPMIIKNNVNEKILIGIR